MTKPESDAEVPDTDGQDLGQELANSLTHGFGLVLSLAGLVWLVLLASAHGDARHIVSCTIYGVSLVMLYASSTLYHTVRNERIKEILNTVDHCCIYLLIAGTYTPISVTLLRGAWGWTLFGIIWGLAVLGITLKILIKSDRWRSLSALTYVLMGWLAIIALKPMLHAIPTGCLVLIAAGGLSYSCGVIFYLKDAKIRYFHAIWHLFVLAGSAFHYFAIFHYVLPAR